jgi:prepilin-type N-terminal cleavage/methylation domain-containing protein
MKKAIQAGFTIVEVTTVIVIIGILVGITAFTISDYRKRTAQSEVASDLNSLVSAMEAARNFSAGYPTSIPSTFKASKNVTVTLRTATASTFCAEAASKVVTTVIYKASNTNKTPVAGTC